MTKTKLRLIALMLIVAIVSVSLAGCDLFFGQSSDVTRFDNSMEASTGKWRSLDAKDTYFFFDGAEGVMTFSYYENGALKYSGSFRSVYRSSPDANNPLTFIFTRSDKAREDWVNCYVENFEKSFTQFCITYEEEDLGLTDGTVYTHIYRMSEMPYKPGTYVLEGEEYKDFSKAGVRKEYYIPEGTYVSKDGQSLAVFPVINQGFSLFTYTNGEAVVEGIFNIAEDKKTIYLYIEHDIYEKVRNADKNNYDTSFGLNYPPDFYLRGDFDAKDSSLVINDLYHHTYSSTEIDDSVWAFGTYARQGLSIHEHTREFHSNEIAHWYFYTCGCETPENSAKHIDVDENFICDGCDYLFPGHEHSYEYSLDDIGHNWSYTCGCKTPPNFAQHFDGNGDGRCDESFCEYHMVSYSISYEGNIASELLMDGYAPTEAKPGNTVQLHAYPLMDAELVLYANGVKMIQTYADYDFWVYIFTMPDEDVVITYEILDGFLPD